MTDALHPGLRAIKRTHFSAKHAYPPGVFSCMMGAWSGNRVFIQGGKRNEQETVQIRREQDGGGRLRRHRGVLRHRSRAGAGRLGAVLRAGRQRRSGVYHRGHDHSAQPGALLQEELSGCAREAPDSRIRKAFGTEKGHQLPAAALMPFLHAYEDGVILR